MGIPRSLLREKRHKTFVLYMVNTRWSTAQLFGTGLTSG
jgi:hypothetical protein